MSWEESKHPRAEDGKFTDGNGSYRQNTSYGEILEHDRVRERNAETSVDFENTGFGKGLQTKCPEPPEFREMMANAKGSHTPETSWRVDIHSVEEYQNDKLFVTEGGSCIAVEPNGNIISVCRNKNDSSMRGSDLLKMAVENGGDRLDAFGNDLYDFYTRNGFEPVSWTSFNEEYAPEGWDKTRDSPEPVIFYKYTGQKTTESYQDFLARIPSESDYGAAEAKRNKEMEK